MAAGGHLVFGPAGNSAIRSADLENPTTTKHEVGRMARCRDMAIRIFPKCEVGRRSLVVDRSSTRRSVGPQYIHCCHVLIFATLRTAREE